MLSRGSRLDDEVDLDNIILKVRSYIDVLPPDTPGLRRMDFSSSLTEVTDFFARIGKKYENKILERENVLRVLRKEKDLFSRNWQERYEKLFGRWRECLTQLERIQTLLEVKQTEKVDELFLSSAQKQQLLEMKRERKANRKFFSTHVLFGILQILTSELDCHMASIFIPSKNDKFLTSIASINHNFENGNDPMNVKIEIPNRKGIVGDVYRKKRKLNVANAYQDKRFYVNVDREIGTTTKALCAYPIILDALNVDNRNQGDERVVLGVLELMNKSNGGTFGVEDETLISRYAHLLAFLMSKVFYLYGNKLRTGHEVKSDDSKIAILDDKKVTKARKKMSIAQRRMSAVATRRGSNVDNLGMGFGGDRSGGDQTGNLESISDMKNAVPSQIEEFVLKLNQCWKKSIKERSQMQSEIDILKNQLEQTEKENAMLRGELGTSKNVSQQLLNRIKVNLGEFKTKRLEWGMEKKKTNAELQKIRTLYTNFLEQSKINVPEHLKPVINPRTKKRLSMAVRQTSDLFQQRNNKRNSINVCSGRNKRKRKMRSEDMKVTSNLFQSVFDAAPTAMIILNNRHRVWRVNTKFVELMDCKEEELLGVSFADVSVGVDSETLPKLFKFDVVQGLVLKIRKKKVAKVTMMITVLGSEGGRFKVHVKSASKIHKGPLYCLAFNKIAKKKK